jgi:predicted acyl esterase
MLFRYKDFAINIYEHAHQLSPKMKVVVGPFVHAMPEDKRNPGPGFDGKAEMVRWFNHWLRDENETSSMVSEPDITLFVRTSLTTGAYRYESQWPIARQQIRRMFMSEGKKLVEQAVTLSTTRAGEASDNNSVVDTLEYRPWIGYEGGAWLGGLTGDQRPFDKDCLVYESDLIVEKTEIVGFVKVSLQVKEWFVRKIFRQLVMRTHALETVSRWLSEKSK